MVKLTRSLVCYLMLASPAGLSLGCKTGGSGAKDKASEAPLPPGLSKKALASDGIEAAVVPADGSNGLPPTLAGLWWADSKTKHFVVSFKGATYDPSSKIATVLGVGPGTYAKQSSAPETEEPLVTPDDPALMNLGGYDLAFSDDFARVDILLSRNGQDGARVVQKKTDKSSYLTYEGEGHWVRHTPGQPSYHLRRIVTLNGKREAAYSQYLAAVGPWMAVQAATEGLSSEKPTVALDVASGGKESYVGVPRSLSSCASVCTVYWTAGDGVTVTLYPANGSVRQITETGVAAAALYGGGTVSFKTTGDKDSNVTVTLVDASELKANTPLNVALVADQDMVVLVDKGTLKPAGTCKVTWKSASPVTATFPPTDLDPNVAPVHDLSGSKDVPCGTTFVLRSEGAKGAVDLSMVPPAVVGTGQIKQLTLTGQPQRLYLNAAAKDGGLYLLIAQGGSDLTVDGQVMWPDQDTGTVRHIQKLTSIGGESVLIGGNGAVQFALQEVAPTVTDLGALAIDGEALEGRLRSVAEVQKFNLTVPSGYVLDDTGNGTLIFTLVDATGQPSKAVELVPSKDPTKIFGMDFAVDLDTLMTKSQKDLTNESYCVVVKGDFNNAPNDLYFKVQARQSRK